ncbi:thioesterase II family protein [Streptomyces sp. NRRL WC-3742]|uniref:thioesterase II family protein n=1 Tax=Streptomyces sp. NRRL WC-3742 TaxID=1463934 RepID=UPI0004C876A4|nr:alpha/beta fold hydrolase [Streptomyces sp. NRRL WC-3742]
MTKESAVRHDLVEDELLRIFEELLKIEGIGRNECFFELGGHSLLAAQLIARIRKRLGAVLPLSVLFEDTPESDGRQPATAAYLAERIHELLDGPAVSATPDPAGAVPLRRQGTGAPLFCVHPAGGEITGFRELAAHLGADRPVYGLHALGAADDADTEVESLATRHLERIRAVQPHGPYALLGWSMGAAIAFEMAGRLREQGESVELLALLDGYLGADLPEYRPLAEDRALQGFVQRAFGLTAAQASGTETVEDPQLLARLTRFESHTRALLRYRPARPVERVLLVFAAAGDPVYQHQAADSWQEFTEAPVEPLRTPGDHFSMFTEPHVRELAALVTAALPTPGESA